MNLIEQLQSKIEQARTLYKEFRLYDLGSFALNRFTPKDGFEQVLNVRYGLKPRHRLDIYRSTKRLAHRPLIVLYMVVLGNMVINETIYLWVKRLRKKVMTLLSLTISSHRRIFFQVM